MGERRGEEGGRGRERESRKVDAEVKAGRCKIEIAEEIALPIMEIVAILSIFYFLVWNISAKEEK